MSLSQRTDVYGDYRTTYRRIAVRKTACRLFFIRLTTVGSFRHQKKQAIKTSDKKQANKSCHKKQNQKTLENIEKIREYLSKNNISKTSDIAEYIGLSLPRTRAILKEIPDVSPIGNNSNRKWTLQK